MNCKTDSKQWFYNPRLRCIFYGMMSRCFNSSDSAYRFYGERGIKVCSEWVNNPISFKEWAISNGYENGLTIDRIDPNKDYEPTNCRWITLSENDKFKSSTNVIEVNGIKDSGRGWAKRLGLGNCYFNKMLKSFGKKYVISEIKKMLSDEQYLESRRGAKRLSPEEKARRNTEKENLRNNYSQYANQLGVEIEDILSSKAFNRRVVRPRSYEQFTKEMDELGWNYSAMGRKYGVSDNTIRKWIKSYEKFGF